MELNIRLRTAFINAIRLAEQHGELQGLDMTAFIESMPYGEFTIVPVVLADLGINPTDRMILAYLVEIADESGWANVSRGEIAVNIGIDALNIGRRMRRLEERGYLKRKGRTGYRVTIRRGMKTGDLSYFPEKVG